MDIRALKGAGEVGLGLNTITEEQLGLEKLFFRKIKLSMAVGLFP